MAELETEKGSFSQDAKIPTEREGSDAAYPYTPAGDFGFRSPSLAAAALAGVRQWRSDAIAGGWDHRPTYGESEPEERAMRLTGPDGWTAQTIARSNERGGAEASIHVWGPDGLAVDVPPFFDMRVLTAALRRCSRCKAENVETQRVGFAGRVCASCITDARKEVETPGWNN